MLIGNFIKDNQSAHLFLPTLEVFDKHFESFNRRQKDYWEMEFGPELLKKRLQHLEIVYLNKLS